MKEDIKILISHVKITVLIKVCIELAVDIISSLHGTK